MPSYPDSIDSSPRSRNTDSWEDPPVPPASLPSKLRLMCSYGGHIVPRPHDKSLCYVGGDTRIVVVDRNTTLSSLSSRLSHTLLNGRPFTLKYQLPSEDLDSLISVTTDEDLDNMIEEYDRTTSSSSSNKPSRIRLFLFPLKPESSQSIGPILENTTKSEDWFLNALNGSGLLNRGFSDSTSVNCLLGLDDDVGSGGAGGGSGGNLDLGVRDLEGSQKNVKQQQQAGQDVHSVPDSPMLETTSSFGSTSSSPSLANLPPIRVHVDDGVGAGGGGGARMQDQKMGIEEQFAQISVVGLQKQQDEGFVVLSSPPPMPTTIAIAGVQVSGAAASGEYLNRVFSDDERSDHGVPVGYRKSAAPPSQTQNLPPQPPQKSGGGHDLPSPDSVASDSSMNNPLSRPKPVVYQDSVVQIPSGVSRVAGNPVDPKINVSDPNTRIPVQDSGYLLQPQFEQQQQQQQPPPPQPQPQQFIHTGTHYIHHHPTGAVPIPAYYHVYPSQQQPHHHNHPQLDQQQYQMFYLPTRPSQAYNLPVQQSSINEAAATMASSRPQTSPNPAMVSNSAAYNPMRNAPLAKPEMAAAGVYRTTAAAPPQLVQVPTGQHQQQYVGYSQIHHPSQSVPPSAGAPNYAYEFVDPAHAQIYYTQPLAPGVPSQYQTMTAAAAMVLPEASSQLPTDAMKQQQQQQIRTSQPL